MVYRLLFWLVCFFTQLYILSEFNDILNQLEYFLRVLGHFRTHDHLTLKLYFRVGALLCLVLNLYFPYHLVFISKPNDDNDMTYQYDEDGERV
jgi:hypothetical protein